MKTAVITASALVAFLALGCGEQKQQAAVESGPAPAVQETPSAVMAAAGTITQEAGATPEAGVAEGATQDLLPPDVTATGPDSLVVPGTVVEITAQASTDVTSMTLMDRLGQKYPMTYDTDAKAWRVQYRVPLKTHIDRLGLSVTATNGTNRWKRVWVFLGIQGGVPEESDGC